MKARLREGAAHHLDPPHRPRAHAAYRGRYHLPLKPGTNVAVVTSLAHVIDEGLVNEKFVRELRRDEFRVGPAFVSDPRHSPEEAEKRLACRGSIRGAARLYKLAATARLTGSASLNTARVHHGDGDRKSRHGDRQYRREGVGVNPLGGRITQGSCDKVCSCTRCRLSGSVGRSHARYVRSAVGRPLDAEPGLRIQHDGCGGDGSFKGLYIRADILNRIPIPSTWRRASPPWNASSCNGS
jgi:formate dehydrogenase major subunit